MKSDAVFEIRPERRPPAHLFVLAFVGLPGFTYGLCLLANVVARPNVAISSRDGLLITAFMFTFGVLVISLQILLYKRNAKKGPYVIADKSTQTARLPRLSNEFTLTQVTAVVVVTGFSSNLAKAGGGVCELGLLVRSGSELIHVPFIGGVGSGCLDKYAVELASFLKIPFIKRKNDGL